MQAQAPPYEQQVVAICRSLQSISEQTRLLPEAVAPDASNQPSGAAVCCQLHGPPLPAAQSQAPAACAPLPELAQQAGLHTAPVEAHVLPVPSHQSAPELAAAVATAGDASLAPPGRQQPSSWIHLDLQQYLHELEPSQWVGAAAAAAAASAATCTAVQGCSLQQQQHDASGGLAAATAADVQQAPPAAAAVLSWMAGVHAAASDSSQQGRRACSRQEQQQRCLVLPTAAVHPNIQPVLQVAPAANANSSSNSSSSTDSVCVLVEHVPTDAVSLLRHSPAVLGGDWHLRCLLHQLLHALADLHARGFAMGGFSLDQVRLICPGWVQLLVKPSGLLLPPAKGARHVQQQQQQQQQQGGVTPGQGLAAVGQPQQQQLLPQQVDQQERQQQPWRPRQQQQQGRWSQGALVVSEPHYTLPQLTEMWRQRVISNFEYLLWVNAAAGRRWGDRKRHPFVPWVIDFSRRPDLGPAGSGSGNDSGSTPPPGWRDLGVSQYRRIKGDTQLDQTYAMSAAAAAAAGVGPNGPWSGRVAGAPGAASSALAMSPWSWEAWDGSSSSSGAAAAAATAVGSGFGFSALGGMAEGPGVSCAPGAGRAGAAAAAVQPHHISNEPMSELSYAIYMARRLPVELLVQLVRRSFRPEEYPSSLEGLYHSSPDEALPQFYADPAAFESTHASMRDLAVPGWAADAADFVRLHRAALESEYVSANLHKWIDLSFGVALSGPAGLAAKNIHLGSTDSSSSSSGKLPATAAAGGGLVVPGVEPCTWGVFQLFQEHHPTRSTRDSSSSSSLQASVVEQQQQQQQQSDGPSAPRPDSATSSSNSSSDGQPPGLQDCWIELTSLEAAAAAGCWLSGRDPASKQQQQHQKQQQQRHLQQGLPPIRSASHLSSSTSVDRPAVLLPAEAAAADLAALGQVALQLYTRQQQQIALGSSSGLHAAQQCWRYCSTSTNKESSSTCQRSSSLTRRSSSSRNSSRGLAGGGSSDSNNSNRPGLTGSRQTGAGLQSGSRQQCVPPAVSMFVQQCGSGSFSAAELLQVSTFLPPWLEDARRFMLQLLFEHRHQQQQQQQPTPQQQQQQQQPTSQQQQQQQQKQAAEDEPTRDLQQATEDGSSSSSSSAAGYQLVCDPFARLAELCEPGGALDSLAAVPEALEVCLPAVLHIVRGALLHGSPARTIHQQQQQQPQQQQEQALLLLDAACLVVFRLSMVLSGCQLQQHLVPLLVALLTAEAGETQNNAAHPSAPSAAAAAAAAAESQQQHAGSTGQDASPAAAAAAAAAAAGITEAAQAQQQQQQQQQDSAGRGLSAALRVAVCRRAVLQPALWGVLLQKLGQQQLLGMLLPPLHAVTLESHPDALCVCLAAAGEGGERTDTSSSRQQPMLPPHQAQLQQCLSQAELAAGCLAVLSEALPFPVVAQHVLRPLMLALPAGMPPAPSNCSAAKASTASPSQLASSSQPADAPSAAASAAPQPPLVPTAAAAAAAGGAAVWPAFRAACGLLSVAQVLPSKLVEEFIFRPLLAMSLLPAHAAGVSVAAGGGRSGSSGSPGGGANTGRLALAALPVLEGLLLSLLPLCKAECMLPSLPPAAAAPPAATSATSLTGPTGGPVTTTALGGASAFSTLASSGPSSTVSGSNSLASSVAGEAAAAGVPQSAASLSRNSSLQQPSYAAAVTAANKAVAAAVAVPFWRLAELLLIGPDVQAVAVCPLLYPRLAALLLVGLEGCVLQAAASSTAGSGIGGSSSSVGGVLAGSNSNSSSSSMSSVPATAAAGGGGVTAAGTALSDAGSSAAREQLLSLYSGWVVPCVLQPLLSQQSTAAWGVLLQSQQQQQQEQQQQQQQQQQEGVRRAYWRAVLLLYAAAVHRLGLGAVRAALPDWHSVEVWLLAETGWEPGQTSPAAPAPAAAAAQGTPSPTLQLLTAMAWQGSSSSTQGSVSTSSSTSSSIIISSSEAEVLQQVGLLATLPRLGSAAVPDSSSDSSGGSSSNIRAGTSLTPGRQQGGVHDLLAPGNSSNSSSSQIAGRVTHLLQRIAEDKVARRSLNTTHEFLEGVGWSLPRPMTPTAAAGGGGGVAGNGAVIPAFAADSSALPPFMQQQQRCSYAGAAGRKGTYSSADGGGLRSRPLSAATPSSSSSSSQVQPDAEAMHRAASAPAPAGVVRRSTAPPAAAVGGAALTAAEVTAAAARLNAGLSHRQQQQQPPAAAPKSSTAAVIAAAAAAAGADEQSKGQRAPADPAAAAAAAAHGGSSSAVAGGALGVVGQGGVGPSWAAELSQLRTLLETPTRTSAGERGPSAGKEWFWLRNNPKLTPSHLLPDISHNPAAAAPSSSSSSSASPASFSTWATAGSSRPWIAPRGVWWEEGWRLGAVCLHSWPAHKERLRALAVDPWERLLVTAGRGGAREPGSSSASSWVVRIWELADAEAKVQYAAHTAAVHQVAFLGPCSPAVASLDVSGALHVWSRATGAQLQAFVPLDPAEQGPAAFLPAARLSPVASRQAAAVGAQTFGAGDGRLGAAAAGGVTAAGGAGGAAAAAARQSKEQHAAAVPGNAAALAAADSRRASVGVTTAAGGGAAAEQQLPGYTGSGPTGAVGGLTVPASGGYWERGCSSGRGWQALAAVPTASGGAAGGGGFGSSVSPGPAGAAGGVLDAAGAAAGAAAALGGPGWPLAGGHLGYTCMVPVDSSHAVVESLLLSGSSGSSGDGCYGSSGGSNAGMLLAGTADGHVCMLDVETGALLEDAVACWDSRTWLYGSGLMSGQPRGQQAQVQQAQQQQQQQQQAQANSSLGPAGGVGVLGPAGWDGLSTAGDPSSCVLSAVCCSSRGMGGGGGGPGAAGAWVGAGSGGGRVTLLDMRSGTMVATWQAHGARVSQLQALAGAQGDHMLLSCSADRTMKLWDLRMVPQAAAPHTGLGGGGFGGSSGGGLAAPLMTYRSGRDGIEGFVVYQDAAIVYGGAGIGLAPLEVPLQAGGVGLGQWGGQLQHQHQQQQGSNVQLVRMTAVRGLGHRGAGVREGLGAAGTGAVVGLGLLPHSKLLVVGTEDGLLRICR